MKYSLIFFLLLNCFFVLAQTETDQQLAQHYYNNAEFDKALIYYEKLFAKDPSKFNVTRYYDCLVATNQTKEAEKLLKKQVAQNRQDIDLQLMLAQFYEDNHEEAQATKIYQELIESIGASPSLIIQVYNGFRQKGKNEFAFATIEKGRKLLKDSYPLHFQFADYYGATNQKEKMVNEYLDLIDYNEGYASSVQNIISKQFDLSDENSVEYNLIKSTLLQRIQKNADKTVYSEMLIWLFLQKKNFNAALTQTISLDKRLGEDGKRIYDLGKVCVENGDFEVARKAFQSVIDLGPNGNYFLHAQNAMLNTRFLEVTNKRNFSQIEIQQTIDLYEKSLVEYGRKRATLPLILEQSHIQAFYGNQAENAIKNLTDALNLSGLTDVQKAEVKMKLADVHVLHGDIWEASLLYMQVSNELKFEAIGHEAKFKNAKIFYYDGEFDFAQSQLSVLKESTSKLIANDALQLSIMITDNYGLDSNFQAMYWFAQADLLIEQHQYESAFQLFDSIIKMYPYHSLGDEILIKKAKAMTDRGEFDKAIVFLEELLKYYSTDILADDALFLMGEIYEKNLINKEKAAEAYKKILFEHKGSLYGDEVRKRYRLLRESLGQSSDDL